MLHVTRTTTLLLEGLHDPQDRASWEQFDRRYRPIILAFARRLGASEADAADVAQETLVRFVQEYRAGRYDRQRGRLRTWLMSIARTRAAMLHRGRQRRREEAAEIPDLDHADEHQLTMIWEAERRTAMLREAMGQLRSSTRLGERTIAAFELFAVERVPVAAVAEQLGMTPHDVYVAKNRVAERLREIIAALEQAYEE